MTVAPTTAAPTTAATTTASGAAGGSLSSLTNNFNNFLKLLMTQLQNQDPTSPMDTNQFTSQLVQFTSVEQQINTNSSLATLIQATQGSNLLQSSALVGHTAEVSGDQVSLQSGQATLHFTGTAAQPVSIGLYSASGAQVASATVAQGSGTNSWTWDGTNANGQVLPDGAYKAVVKGADGTAVPFTSLGTVTGIQRSGTTMNVQLGGLSVDLNTVQSVR